MHTGGNVTVVVIEIVMVNGENGEIKWMWWKKNCGFIN